jgi:hypothetical protein
MQSSATAISYQHTRTARRDVFWAVHAEVI